MNTLKNLEQLLASGQDNALLRFSLGSSYFRDKQHQQAIDHLVRAVEYDPEYSAAWKILGKALAASGQLAKAVSTFEKGIEVAEKKGDIQAAREMKVFLKRLKGGDW
jgi:Tfp pilus assembly protein PilF